MSDTPSTVVVLPGQGASSLRVPPHSVEAEQAVLGGVLLDPRAWEPVIERVKTTYFYRQEHQIIFEAMKALAVNSEPIDIITVSEYLVRKGQLDKAGGMRYLGELAHNTPSAANIRVYADIVCERAILRALIVVGSEITESAFHTTGKTSAEILDAAEQKVFHIAEQGKRGEGPEGIQNIVARTLERIETRAANGNALIGLSSGFSDFDRMTSGLQPGELIILAGRPSMGKTMLSMNIVEHVAITSGKAVLMFSMEMPAEALVLRMLSSLGRIDQQLLSSGRLEEADWARVSSAVSWLNESKLIIDETPSLSPIEMQARARRVAREHPLGLIVIDYLQLMQASGRAENRTAEISEISRSLKALAKTLQVPVIALSQLNRSLEQRPNKRPVMSDLRECVAGDTLVCLVDGRRVPIRELVGTFPEVLAMNAEKKIVTAKSDCVWSKGLKPIYKLVTASGRILRATKEHRIYCGEGWKTIADTTIGEKVALARDLPCVSSKDWDEQAIILLGHMIGDGSYIKRQPMRYTTASEENSLAVKIAAESFGSTVTRAAGPTGTWHQLIIAGNGNRWHPQGVGAWLKNLGIFGQRSVQKQVPQDIFELSKEKIALFLRHLWATDGCIYLKKTGKIASRVYFSTCSEYLARDVQALLLRLGVLTRLRRFIQKTNNQIWSVDVSGAEQQLKFLELVGAFGPRVEPAERLRVHLLKIKANTNVDTLPQHIFEEIKYMMKELHISQREMAKLRGTAYGGSSHFSFAPSREVVGSYAHLLDSAHLKQWAESDLFWDPIVSIEPDGEEEVFDLTVPEYASWLADGLVSHNSGAIEQDADLIVFIYRDEVYYEDSEDKGTAEIIIGKHRNGPIGMFRLTFLGQYMRFENFSQEHAYPVDDF